MEDLNQVKEGYQDLFRRTGKIEFFMHAKCIEKLIKNISLVEELNEEDNLTL